METKVVKNLKYKSYSHREIGITYSSQSRRYYFGCVSGRDDLENTPWNTSQQVTDKNHGEVLSEEEDENTSAHSDHPKHVDGSVTVFSLSPSVDE
jgi:hypothetical protein